MNERLIGLVRTRHIDRGTRGAVGKSTFSNGCHRPRDIQTRDTGATIERMRTYRLNLISITCLERIGGDGSTTLEGVVADIGQ